MEETLKDIIFRLTGLPLSAFADHALLEHDLGINQVKMKVLMQRLDTAFGLQTDTNIWCVFQRVGDVRSYVADQLESKG